MKFLLAALNAKYIHSNPGIYSLKTYAEKYLSAGPEPVEIGNGEYTINNQMDDILKDIYQRKPDVVGFSCYIWNISYVLELVRDLPSVLPGVEIWLGGPEVSYDASKILENEPEITGIMMGEGEETFLRLLEWYGRRGARTWESCPNGTGENCGWPDTAGPEHIDGLAARRSDGSVFENPLKKAMDLSTVPFPYGELTDFEHRIVYYESSRGCPFSCSYCLSSLDKSVRFRDLELVKRELAFFLERRVLQVKFVDRTFNCSRHHTLEIWRYLLEHDNGITNFHFEISADLLDEEELAVIEQMRPGLIQLEIGVQSTNPDTIREIHRTMDLDRLKQVVNRVKGFGNTHQHLDLIAGLPFEDYESFGRSFNEVYRMRPDQLQLGFLKVLKGSHMAEAAHRYGLKYKSEPPYEVLKTEWLDYGGVLRLKGVEEMVEVYYNSGQFTTTLREMEKEFESPFEMFERLAQYYEDHGLFGISHSRMARYEILERFLRETEEKKTVEREAGDGDERIRAYWDFLVYDLYLRENLKSRPPFARDQEPYKERIRAFFAAEAEKPVYLTEGYDGYEARQMIKMAHIEVFGEDTAVLFDYKRRDPLSYNAAAVVIPDFICAGAACGNKNG